MIIEVVAGVIYKDDKFLIAQRNLNKAQGGLWEFPGGKVEKGENFTDALIREIKEESERIIAETKQQAEQEILETKQKAEQEILETKQKAEQEIFETEKKKHRRKIENTKRLSYPFTSDILNENKEFKQFKKALSPIAFTFPEMVTLSRVVQFWNADFLISVTGLPLT